MPSLQGTERQVAYAEIVRLEILARVSAYVETWETLPDEGLRTVVPMPAWIAVTQLEHRLGPEAMAELQILALEDLANARIALGDVMGKLRAITVASEWLSWRRLPAQGIVALVLSE